MCRDQSGIVAEDVLSQRFSVAVHPSRHLMLFSDGFSSVTAAELSGTISCLSLMKQLTTASEQTLGCMLQLNSSTKSSFLSTSMDNDVATQGVLDAKVCHSSTTRSHYHFEATLSDLPGTVPDHDVTLQSDIDHIDHGRIQVGHVKDPSNSDGTVSSGDNVGMVSKALMSAWRLAATNSGVWTPDHESVAADIARCFVKLFAFILVDVGSGEEGGTRLRRVLELFRHVVIVASLDQVGQHLSAVLVSFIRSSAQLFLEKHLTAANNSLHALCDIALAVRFAEQHYARIYSLRPADHTAPLSTLCNLDSTSVPPVYTACQMEWTGLKEKQTLTSLHRLAGGFSCCT